MQGVYQLRKHKLTAQSEHGRSVIFASPRLSAETDQNLTHSPSDVAANPDVAAFEAYRSHLRQLRQSNMEKADGLVLTLSSAVLGLSTTFLKAGGAAFVFSNLLIGAWCLFGISIVLVILSYLLGQPAVDRQLSNFESYVAGEMEYESAQNPWTGATTVCNYGALIAFATAIFLMVWFLSINVSALRGKQEIVAATPTHYTQSLNRGTLQNEARP